MFFNIDFSTIKKYNKLIFIGLILISIISVSLNIMKTPNFIGHTSLEDETLSILNEVDDKFVILATPSRTTSYIPAYYSYAAIYHNLTSAGGWYPAMKSSDYISRIENLTNIINKEDCRLLKKELVELETYEVITYNSHCDFLNECGFNKKDNKSRVCLYYLRK